MNILDIRGVSKHYREVTAVNSLSMIVPKQTVFGLLGPNGAGKTSLIRMITQITGVDEGKILFDGEPLASSHTSQIGYMPEERGLYKKMKIGEQLVYLAQLKDMTAKEAKTKIHEWFERFEIQDWWGKKVEDLSKGMQQKVQFISTVMHEPKLLILDEPFSGLDPINANLIRDEIFRLVKERNLSVIFSTHRMEQVEEICEEIALVNQGNCVLSGSMKGLKEQFKKNQYRLDFDGDMSQTELGEYQYEQVKDDAVIFQLSESQSSNELLRKLVNSSVGVKSFKEVLPTMNEIFIEQVNRS